VKSVVNLENPKLLALDAAVARREAARVMGKKVVLTNGVFDLLHTGHLYFLQKPAPSAMRSSSRSMPTPACAR
jgi:bifunctional ADP-heptose synthase (sugar kinase/adenylyltransferase)